MDTPTNKPPTDQSHILWCYLKKKKKKKLPNVSIKISYRIYKYKEKVTYRFLCQITLKP
jgi:hypothetical protein